MTENPLHKREGCMRLPEVWFEFDGLLQPPERVVQSACSIKEMPLIGVHDGRKGIQAPGLLHFRQRFIETIHKDQVERITMMSRGALGFEFLSALEVSVHLCPVQRLVTEGDEGEIAMRLGQTFIQFERATGGRRRSGEIIAYADAGVGG